MEFTPDLAVFVGGMVALVFLFTAALTYVVAPGQVVQGFAMALAALGVVFFAIGVGVAGALVLWRR
ncbi:MAG: hypothetical protein ABEJ70_01455 [Halobacteriaceae archaeon]